MRAYNLIYNEWFRDENLINSAANNKGDGPDALTDYALRKRGKRHDYFTSALPWPQKGGQAVTIPLGTSAPIRSDGNQIQVKPAGSLTGVGMTLAAAAGSPLISGSAAGGGGGATWNGAGGTVAGMYADLTTATAATINQLRQSFQIQNFSKGTHVAEPDTRKLSDPISELSARMHDCNDPNISEAEAAQLFLILWHRRPERDRLARLLRWVTWQQSAQCSQTATDSHNHSQNTDT